MKSFFKIFFSKGLLILMSILTACLGVATYSVILDQEITKNALICKIENNESKTILMCDEKPFDKDIKNYSLRLKEENIILLVPKTK